MNKDKFVTLLESINLKLDRVLEAQDFLLLKNWDWPKNPRIDKIEYDCPHGVGHGGVHGCDGCCRHQSFKKTQSKEKKK